MNLAIFDALKGVGNRYELQRVLGALGTVIYAVGAPLFVASGMFGKVTLGDFSLWYPVGLAACIGASAGTIALKDHFVAGAKASEAVTDKVRAETAARFPEQSGPPPQDVKEAAEQVAGAAADKKDQIVEGNGGD